MIQINNDSDMQVQLESPQLKYQASDVEGQCKISSITCVKRQIALYFLFILFNIIFVCIPLLLTSWFTNLKRLFYYRPCPLSQATHFHIINYDGLTTFAEKKEQLFYFSKKKIMKVIYFDNRYLRYIVYNNHVEAARFNYIQRVNQIMNSNNVQKQSYQNQTDVIRLRQLYGEGSMKLKYLPFYRILFQQLIRPLHIFIVFSCSLWFYEKYYYYSSIILFTLLSGIFVNAYQIHKNNKRIFQLAYYKQQISALRNGQIVKIQSTQLVPGDIVFLKKNKKIPFDGIILEGNALVNQSSLTGESVHVLRGSYIENINNQLKNCHICDGSTLVNISNKKKYQKFQHYRELGIPVMVKNTNFTTIKGQIIRIIAYPRQKENIFQKHSTKLLLIMFMIAIISFIVLIIRLAKEYENESISKKFQMFFVKFLDLIVITVPPCITITMTSSTILAIKKLKNKKISCRIPTKINEGGLVNLACFDKTGILTKDFMNFQCLHLYNDKQFDVPITHKENLEANFEKIMKRNKNFIHALNNISMVHQFTYIQSTKQLVGDLQQKELFQHFEYQLQNQSMVEGSIMCFKSKRGINGSVFRRFQYDCFRFVKSAIGKSNKTGEQYYLYAKGAPQQIKRLLNPSKIPPNFDKILKFYTSQGFRVIAIGSRKVDEQSIRDPREQLQNNLNFDGFQVFQSQLKQHTKQSIQEILKAHVSCVMITGDNPLTACNVAFKCGIANPFKKTQIYDIYKNSLQQQQFKAPSLILQQRDKHYYSDLVGSSQILFNNRNQQQIRIKKQHFQLNGQRLQEQISKNIMNPKIQFCLTGPAFNFLFRNSNQQLTQIQRNILLKTTIFARANPNDKIKIVYLYKKIGKKVLMCGDGANDCGALRQANIGLSLSNGQAEISAPFSSENNNITVVVQLLKQCRAALVTQFSLFNSLALYSLIQYTTTISAQFHYSYPYDFQYLYWDVFCSLIFFLTYGKTKTAKKLSSQIPSANLVSISNITKILIIFLFQLVGQVLVLQGMHQFFVKNLENQVKITKQIIVQGRTEIQTFPYSNTLTYQFFKKDLTLVTSHSAENSALFLFTNIMYIYSVLAFFVSSPWRRKFFTNPIFSAFLIVILTYNLIMIVVPGSRISFFDSDMLVSQIYNWYIFGLAVGIGFVMYFVLNFFYEPFFKWLKNKYPDKQWI